MILSIIPPYLRVKWWCSILLVSIASILAAGCTNEGPANKVNVVTTSNIVADWVHQVGEDKVEVLALVPAGSDPHTFQPGARDVTRVAEAEVVFTVGLRLEAAWLDKLVENAAAEQSRILALGEFIDPIEFEGDEGGLVEATRHVVREVEEGQLSVEEGLREIKELLGRYEEEEEHAGEEALEAGVLEAIHQAEGGAVTPETALATIDDLLQEVDGHEHRELDPHFWMDPLRVERAVAEIASRLILLDPENRETYRNNEERYARELEGLHTWIGEQITEVPQERKVLVTTHESLGYFAERYGFEIVGTVIPGLTTEREPTALELTDLVDTIKEHGAPVVFAEAEVSDRLARTIAEEAGARVVSSLYTASLQKSGSGAETYIGMMKVAVAEIVGALK